MTAPGRPGAQDTSASPSAARSTLGASRDRTGQPFAPVTIAQTLPAAPSTCQDPGGRPGGSGV